MPAIVYLHGFASGPGSSKARYFQERLGKKGAHVLVPDLAAGDFANLTITGQLGVVEGAAARRPVSLIGSSMGGYLAALYAAAHPEVSRVVLMAPAFGFARLWADRLGPQALAGWRASGHLSVFHYGENRALPLSYRLLEDASQYEEFPEVSQPVLLFHGLRDDVVPVDLSRQYAASRPNVRLELVDSGHELLDFLERMGDEVERFLLQAEAP